MIVLHVVSKQTTNRCRHRSGCERHMIRQVDNVPGYVRDELLKTFDAVRWTDARVDSEVLHHSEVRSDLITETFTNTSKTTCSHLCASVTKQCNLVLVEGQ